MIEEIIIEYLGNVLDVPVAAEEPENAQQEYIVVEKTGGGSENFIHFAMITVQSYAITKFEAGVLNEKVKEAMSKLAEIEDVCSCRINSDYDYTDTGKKRYRYQAVYDIVHY